MSALQWRRLPVVRGSWLPRQCGYASTDGAWRVLPSYARGRGGQRTKRVVWVLYTRGRRIGRPFAYAWLAKRYAAEYAAADTATRRDMLRNGGQLCAKWEDERRQAGRAA